MAVRDYFSGDYSEARRKFRDAATRAGASLAAYVNPKAKSPKGEELATDVARLGPRDARGHGHPTRRAAALDHRDAASRREPRRPCL